MVVGCSRRCRVVGGERVPTTRGGWGGFQVTTMSNNVNPSCIELEFRLGLDNYIFLNLQQIMEDLINFRDTQR